MRKSPDATLPRIFKLPCVPAQRDTRHFTPLILQTKNEPSPFGIETEKAHLCCTTPVKRRRTLAALCLILRQHTVSDAKLVDDVALLARRYAHFLEDVPHVDLQFLDAAIARIPSDRPNDGGI